MPGETVLSLESVTHASDHLQLEGFTLELQAGQALAILGPPHAPKTDFLRLCAGLVPPQQGRVRQLGLAPHDLSPAERARLQSCIAFIHEQPLFLNNVRFFDNLALPLRYHSRLTEVEIEERVMRAAARAEIADFKRAVLPMTYPRRFLKRATYARALTMEPRLIVIEEIASLIDEDDRAWLSSLLKAEKARGAGLVFSSRTLDLVQDLSDSVLLLDASGRVLALGDTASVVRGPALAQLRAGLQESS